MSMKQQSVWVMACKLSKTALAVSALLMLSVAQLLAAPAAPVCWVDKVPQQLIDVDGEGTVQGAWSVPSGLLMSRLEQAGKPQGLLVAGYDVLTARRICGDALAAGLYQTQLVFGGRERVLAQQGAPAWDWLLVSSHKVASNVLSGELAGIFIGKGKAVVGKGLQTSTLTDPAEVAVMLMDGLLRRQEPVVLFISTEYQQTFFDFFSNNPLPGVFLSFDEAESVRDILNKYVSVSANDQVRDLNYYCN
ncbi:hypothetical protein [Atopomonas hussainii]|uniref:hypothetical protein n=1 Tax=Atopomonas hussainii TaxID=1429083 RepID=UPI0011149D03|nr:hypothetical protein [Atopomonas hussainii]